MADTSRELVTKCLTFNYPERVPRDLWMLPWANDHYPDMARKIKRDFPTDFTGTEYYYSSSNRVKGDPYKSGFFTDEWGCIFKNIQDGIIGEVDVPIIQDIEDWKLVQPPYEQLPLDKQKAYDIIKRSYDRTDKFVNANICPRPWERYQFLRGTMNALTDVLMPDLGFKDLLQKINDFYKTELDFWVKSEVDGIMFMDDWGAQNQLLIPPELWREYFKPIYREYCEAAKAEGKFVFMHSDGYISEIYPDLIEIGVDAVNSQLFCMDMSEISRIAKGKITFWGEIDRQHILTSTDPDKGREAVREIIKHLYDPSGGIIAQFEFGLGTHPDTAYAVFDEWSEIDKMNFRS